MNDRLLDVNNMIKYFPIEEGLLRKVIGYVKAVDDVSFYIHKGETFGLVGESGCGKTTVAKTILRAFDPDSGEILFNHKGKTYDMAQMSRKELKKVRLYMQMIFQDPFSSLNPRMSILEVVGEPLIVNNIARGRELREIVGDLLERVGLKKTHLNRYPHAFSGGQRQRIGIARALSVNPNLIVADEPVSALDASVQAQILNLMEDIQEEFDLSYLLIAHDLSVVQHICDRVAVMYVGKLVESAPTDTLFFTPAHPYTEALMSSVPPVNPKASFKKAPLEGEVADPSNPPSGCYFHTRCKYSRDICREEFPELNKMEDDEEHYVACHFAGELDLNGVPELDEDIARV